MSQSSHVWQLLYHTRSPRLPDALRVEAFRHLAEQPLAPLLGL